MKKVLALFVIIILVATIFNFIPIKAFGGEFNASNIPNQEASKAGEIKTSVQKVVGTTLLVLQVFSIAGLIILGVRYMYSGPEQKAILKKGSISVLIGLILVFGCSTVAQFIVNAYKNVTNM